MKIDRRHAIIIGIDDYAAKSLDYCVQDALAIKEALIKYCLFKEEDIHLIASTTESHISDITGHFTTVLERIKADFDATESSLFFYFAGHGETHFDASFMAFHDSQTSIQAVFEPLNALKPKFLTMIVDACESGSKVNSRGKANTEPTFAGNLEQFIKTGTGYVLMLACENTQKAKEHSRSGHGLFTYQILSCLESAENYDADGILDPDRITSYIKKHTSTQSKFNQVPVVEVYSTGYYPFALSQSAQNTALSELTAIESKPNDTSMENTVTLSPAPIIDTYPNIDEEIRTSVFQQLQEKVSFQLNRYANSFPTSVDYSIQHSMNLNALPSNIEELVKEKIITEAHYRKIEGIGNLFSSRSEPIQHHNKFLTLGYLGHFLSGGQEQYRTVYTIRDTPETVISGAFHLASNNVNTPECGFGFVIYQAVFGLGFADFTYMLEWDGYSNRKPIGPRVQVSAFRFHAETLQKISEKVSSVFTDFEKKHAQWYKERKDTIEQFYRISS